MDHPLLCECELCMKDVYQRPRQASPKCDECGDVYNDTKAPFVILSQYPPGLRSLVACSSDCLRRITFWTAAERQRENGR